MLSEIKRLNKVKTYVLKNRKKAEGTLVHKKIRCM